MTTTRNIEIEGRFAARFRNDKIVGWTFTPDLGALAIDMERGPTDLLDTANWDGPFWTQLRDVLDRNNGIMTVNWTEDGPSVEDAS